MASRDKIRMVKIHGKLFSKEIDLGTVSGLSDQVLGSKMFRLVCKEKVLALFSDPFSSSENYV